VSSGAPLLAFSGVSKRHWRGHRPIDVLADVSLDLHAGELGAVWGPRGAGKTTLVELAAGLVRPDAGAVLIDGQDVATMSRRKAGALLHRDIGVATGDGPATRELSVRHWVALALLDRVGWRAGLRRAQTALERVGAGDAAGAAWHELSDGERTLASIARAVVREPRLLLVDDPSAGLGLLERGEVGVLLRSLAEEAGVAVLVTASELGEVQGAHSLWSLAGGRLVGGRSRTTGTVVPFPGRGASAGA
jgi:putative ABC transport system ATP-binding protein